MRKIVILLAITLGLGWLHFHRKPAPAKPVAASAGKPAPAPAKPVAASTSKPTPAPTAPVAASASKPTPTALELLLKGERIVEAKPDAKR